MREVDTGEVALPRYPIPDGVVRGTAKLAKWMRIVGIAQAAASGLATVLLGLGAISVLARPALSFESLVLLALLGALVLLFRQALLLQSAADHFTEIGTDPDDAHDHLQLAFARLRPVFVIDVVIAALLLLRSLLLAGVT